MRAFRFNNGDKIIEVAMKNIFMLLNLIIVLTLTGCAGTGPKAFIPMEPAVKAKIKKTDVKMLKAQKELEADFVASRPVVGGSSVCLRVSSSGLGNRRRAVPKPCRRNSALSSMR